MDAIEIEGIEYLVMRKNIDNHARSNSISGSVPEQCVVSNDVVVVMAHSDGGNRLMLDMKFDGLDDPVKLVLIVDDAYSLKGVLQEFIECVRIGGEDG